jgi:hypothetical protein
MGRHVSRQNPSQASVLPAISVTDAQALHAKRYMEQSICVKVSELSQFHHKLAFQSTLACQSGSPASARKAKIPALFRNQRLR